MENISKIEEHLYVNKNGTIRAEYRIYNGLVYEIKTKSQLSKTEKNLYKKDLKQYFTFNTTRTPQRSRGQK